MIKMMSLLLTFFIFMMTVAMTFADDTPQVKTADSSLTNEIESTNENEVANENEEAETKDMIDGNQNSITIMRLTWKLIPYAVKYKVEFDDEEHITYINGIELAVKNVSTVFRVSALDFDDNIIAENLDILSTETNPLTVKPTTEFDKMDDAPLYPVYSWIPKLNADYYQIQLLKDGNIVRNYVANKHGDGNEVYDFYDNNPVNESGTYYWRVRAMSNLGIALSEWSKESDSVSFKVKAPTKYAAFGDSITHGGGAITVPPSMTIYNWETYCEESIKNLGRSGDSTDQLVDRFDTDVLPFAPKILFIMGGVNDFRSNILGWHSVSNLKIILEKCNENNIIPVFVTPTPVNPRLINKTKFINPPPYDWQEHYKYICDWIRKQKHYIDLSLQFEDYDGFLRYDLTTDGLHPDLEGKRILGEAVNDWIKNYSADN